MSRDSQRLPATGPEREALREKGQFWTPDWVSKAMVGYVIAGGAGSIFDPAVGAGAFFRAARQLARERGFSITLMGAEIDHHALIQARQSGLTESDLCNVQITDFVLHPPQGPYRAIVANPPYIRHHRLSATAKSALKAYSAGRIGKALDGRAGLHIYFLLRALQLLDRNGRLAFIMPADTCEGVFAPLLWNWITQRYRLDAVVTFAPEASPFPGVDTNPIIFMLRNTDPQDSFLWARCHHSETPQLTAWLASDFKQMPDDAISVHQRQLSEALATGLSRPPLDTLDHPPVLKDFATALRGIATGANEYFFLTGSQVNELDIPDAFLIRAIGRTRDIDGDQITEDTLRRLEEAGRPTWLFAPGSRPLSQFPEAVRRYLEQGEAMGIHRRTLIATRHPWYKMETRPVPPILFAYLGRRNARFIRNLAGVLPLTGFLCVYPNRQDADFIERLWRILQHPGTIANLPLVGKSYGGGAIKVEPRALERLPIPESVLAEAGLTLAEKTEQMPLFSFA